MHKYYDNILNRIYIPFNGDSMNNEDLKKLTEQNIEKKTLDKNEIRAEAIVGSHSAKVGFFVASVMAVVLLIFQMVMNKGYNLGLFGVIFAMHGSTILAQSLKFEELKENLFMIICEFLLSILFVIGHFMVLIKL